MISGFFTTVESLYKWIFYPSEQDPKNIWLLKAFLGDTLVFVPIVVMFFIVNRLFDAMVTETTPWYAYLPLQAIDIAGLYTTSLIYLKLLVCDFLKIMLGCQVCP